MLLSIIFYGGNISISSPWIGCVPVMSCVEDLFQCFFTKTSVAPPSLPPNSPFQIFSYAQLDEATDHFNVRHSLGMGGFGTVYIGKLADGRKVAVKRYHEHKSKAIQQFKKEIEILSILQHHPNLVSLYGFSFNHSHELLLVFKFVPNGALNHHLLPYVTPSDHHLLNSVLLFLRKQLSWPTRLNIAIETASALSYLHRCGIIHRDVKSRNILLDEDLSVKVADFGLSMFVPVDESECVTDNIVSTSVLGTPGYIDPEYLVSGKVSDKSDVYSFGVVLLELISSKPAVWKGENSEFITLADFAVTKILNQQLEEIVDPSLGFCSDEKVRDTITAVAELAFQCVQCSRELRPSSKQVLEILRGIEQGIWRFYQVT